MKKFILSSLLFLSACSSDAFLVNHGNMPPQSKISQIELGNSKQQVINSLGTPSNISPLNSNTWIYMASTSKKIAFLEPKLISRDILVIKFNPEQSVTSIVKKDELSGKEVVIATEKTTTQGANQDQNFFEKAFGTLNPAITQ